VSTDVSEEHIASIFMVEDEGGLVADFSLNLFLRR
jgi:hypothetical protein